ncbi:MAG TPA: hypothetical protein PL060_00500 [bacterium]|nr:hypothetical protein [bacterium]
MRGFQRMQVFLIMLMVILVTIPVSGQTKWWNNQWNFRSAVQQDIQPVMPELYAAKINFTSLLDKISPENRKLDISSIRVIGVKKDGTFAEVKFNFVPRPDFDEEKNARGIIVWEKGLDIERYYVYFDVAGVKGKPVSQYKSNLDINLLSGGSFDNGQGEFKLRGDAGFDESTGYIKKGSMKMRKKKDADDSSYIFSAFLPAEPDTMYDLIFFGKSDAEEGSNFAIVAYVNYYDENNKYIDRKGARLEVRGTFDWTPYTMSVKTPAKAKKIAVHIQTYQETGYVWVDDIRISPHVEYIIDSVEKQTGQVQSMTGSKIPFDFVEIKYPDFYKPEAKIDPEEHKTGFFLWESRPENIIYPYTKAPEIRKKEIRAWGCAGEILARNFCIRPFVEFDAIQMEITGDLKNMVEIREMIYLPRKYLGNTYHVIPFYLDRVSGKLEKGVTTQYYLTFSIPENAKSGIYNGSIKIKAIKKTKEEVLLSVPLSLRVLPVKLQKPDDVYWGFFYGNHDWASVYGSDPNRKVFYPEQEPSMFRHMVQHNANMIGITGCLPPYETKDGKYNFDFTKVVKGRGMNSLKETLDNVKQAGFQCVLIDLPNEVYFHSAYFGVPFMSEKWQDLYVQLIQDIINFIKTNGYPFKVYFLIVDEPANSQKLTEDAITLCKLVKSRVKDVLLYETLHTQTLHKIGPFVDACMIYAQHVNQENINAIKEMKKQLWSDNGGSMGPDYRIDRLYTGFYQYRAGGKAIGQWAYMWPKGPDAYNDFNPRNRGGAHAGEYYALPSSEGPKDTPGIEGFRDGIYDYMYIYTLEKTVENIKKSGNREKIKEAQAIMEEVKKEILEVIPVQYSPNFVRKESFQPDTLEAWRWKIAQKIMALENLK